MRWQENFDAQYVDVVGGFETHLTTVASSSDYAEYVDIVAASRILEGAIEVIRPDQFDKIQSICDDSWPEGEVMMTVGWVNNTDKGHLNHFELWTKPAVELAADPAADPASNPAANPAAHPAGPPAGSAAAPGETK